MDQLSDSDVTVCGVKAQAQFAAKALCLRVSLCPYPHSDHELMEKKGCTFISVNLVAEMINELRKRLILTRLVLGD